MHPTSAFKLSWLIIFLFGLGACSSQNADEISYDTANRARDSIIGGKEVSPDDFGAGLVAMVYSEGEDGNPSICTGAFISDRALLTAAHCVTSDVLDMSVTFSTKPFDSDTSVKLNLVSVVIHEKYKPSKEKQLGENDIAIIFFSGGLPLGAQRVSFPEKYELSKKRQSMMLLGYGRTEGIEQSEVSDAQIGILRSVVVPNARFHPSGDVLYLDQNAGQGVCYGDSGGPALDIENRSGPIILGVANAVVSEPGKVDLCRYRSVYANVSFFLDWIQTKISTAVK